MNPQWPYTWQGMKDSVPNIAYWITGLVLLLIITQSNPRIGGWLLIITVLGLVFNAHQRRML